MSGPVKFERPELMPAWVWCEPPADFDAIRLRGELYFAGLEETGIRVQRVKAGTAYNAAVYQPWTFMFMMLPWDDFADHAEWFATRNASLIMDCHFPIMNMETAVGSDQTLVDIIDRKDTLLANLALADAVTCPRPEWAADLAEVNPNVFVLPDIEAPAWMYDDSDSDEEPSDAEVDEYESAMASAQRFGMRMMEIAQASIRVKQERMRARREMTL